VNHKASAKCSKGHDVEFGSCQAEVKGLLGTRTCGCKLFDVTPDGEATCVKCGTNCKSRSCPVCNEKIPISDFKKKGFWAKLG